MPGTAARERGERAADRTAPGGGPGRLALPIRFRGLVGERGSPRRRIAGNASWSAAVFLANALTTFFLSPFVVDRLGDSAYGLWILLASLTGWFGFADLGIRPAVVHYVARHDARGEPDEVNRYVNSAFAAFAWGGAAVLLFALAARWWLPAWFRVPDALAAEATLAVAFVGLDFALTLPLNAFSAVLVGKQRYGALSRIDLAVLVVRTLAIVALLRAGGGIVSLALAALGASVLEMAAKTWAAFRAEPGLVFRPRLADRARAGRLVRYGLLGLVVAVGGLLAYRTNALVIQAALPLAAITLFQIPAALAFHARALLSAASRVIAPAAGALDARGEDASVARMLESGTRAVLLVGGPILVYLVVVGEAFLARWMGDRFRGEPATVLAVLALGAAAPIASLPFAAVLYGVNGMRSLAAWSAVEGVTNLAISLALVGPLGIVGVAIGTAVPATLVHGWLLPREVCARYGLRFLPFAARAYGAPLVAGLATFVALRLATSPGDSLSWPALGALALLALLVFGAVHALVGRVVRPGARAALGTAS